MTVRARPQSERQNVDGFIERMGLAWESEGLPRIAGRIFGLALITPGAASLDEIADALGVSKASVSNDARQLERLGFIERVGVPGDRKDYYRISRDSLERSLETRLKKLRLFQELVESALALPIRSAEVRQRIGDFELAHQSIIEGLEQSLARLRARRTPAKRRAVAGARRGARE